MNWQKIAIDDLRDYGKLIYSIDSIDEKIEMLNTKLYSLKGVSYSPIPKDGGGTNYEDKTLDYIVEKERLENNKAYNKDFIKWIEKGLNSLDDRQKNVLYTFYVERPKNHVERLMERYGIEKSRVYKIKDEALRNFTLSMYGRIDS